MASGMLSTVILSLLALSPVGAVYRPKDVSDKPAIASNRGYIVEFTEPQGSNAASEFYSNLSRSDLRAQRRLDLAFPLFNGASFRIDERHNEKEAVEKIDSMRIVKKIWPMQMYHPQRAISSPLPKMRRQSASNSTDTFSTHVMTGVDKLHAEGLSGKGKFIAIVDSGIDYNHPALGGGFGPGFKVAKGYDLVGDAYTGDNMPVPDSDPYTECSDHGTHVAGIIGANPNPYNFTGVAPGATLGMYRVFGCFDNVEDDVLIAAFMRAHEDGADVITASIGGNNGWTERPWTAAVSRIVAAGTPCLLAAGNAGAAGMFLGSAAADGIGVIAVGSIDNTEVPSFTYYYNWLVNGTARDQFMFVPADIGMPNVTLPLYATSLDSSVADDACNPLPDSTPDLSGYIVLVKRGSCPFNQKAINVAAKGAQYMMLYNNAAGLVTATTAPSPLKGAGMTTQAQGQQWVAELAGGSEIVLDLNNGTRRFAVAPNNLTAGAMSVFTEWNPTNEAYIKPEISAPGGNILSTVPRNMGAYDVLSGTSMATPFVAGVIGLMLESRSDLKADAIRAILANAGTPVNFNDGTTTYDFLAPVVQQGGGLINAYEAVHTSTVVDVANLAFNDTDHFVSENKFTITNRGSSSITYSLSYVNAPAAYALADDANPVPAPFPPEMVAQGATLDFGYSSSITVSAGQTVEINVAVTPPSGLDSKRIPVYTGFININGTNGDTLSLPYGGIASSLKSATILSQEYLGFPYLTSTADPNYNPVPEGTVFVLPKGNSTNTTTGYPDLLTELAMGSALIRADLIPESTSNATTTTILGVKTLGSIAGFPIPYRSRASAWEQPFTGLMSDDTYAPAGDYSILVRALKIFGDPDKAEDYDSASTQTFSIKYA